MNNTAIIMAVLVALMENETMAKAWRELNRRTQDSIKRKINDSLEQLKTEVHP